jgi:hypothetical protein
MVAKKKITKKTTRNVKGTKKAIRGKTTRTVKATKRKTTGVKKVATTI